MRKASTPLFLLAAVLVVTLPAAAASLPTPAVRIVQAPAAASTAVTAPSASSSALDKEAFLEQLGAPTPQPSATGCSAQTRCSDGSTVSCSGVSTCTVEFHCFVYCDTTGFVRCPSHQCP